ncbi:MAG: ankyrin repeat domain-containing protein [Chthonomonadales bacterium]
MRKKMNRTRVIILIVAALTVAVPLLIVYSYYDRARKSEQLLIEIGWGNTDEALSLLRSGADPNYAGPLDGIRVVAIEVACENRNVEVVRYLLSHGVKPWEVGQDKASLIRRTLKYPDNGSPQNGNEIMQMLIEHGANVNAIDKSQTLPIIEAAAMSMNDALKFLIDHGADVNLATGTNNSSLVVASAFGNKLGLKLLLNSGADPSKCGTTFEQLIEIARKYNHKEAVAILKDAMAKRKAAGSGGLKK